jgi:hypothetical protein
VLAVGGRLLLPRAHPKFPKQNSRLQS